MGLTYARGLELWTRLGSPAEFLNVPYGRLRSLLFRGELASALGLAEDLLRLSRERDDAVGLVQGHFAIGRTLMFIGKFGSARSHLEKSLSLHNEIGRPAISRGVGTLQTGVQMYGVQMYSAIVLACLGYPDQALSNSAASAVEARGLADPISLATSMAMRSRLLSLVGDDMALGEQADQLVSLAIEQGFRQWHAQGTIYRGWRGSMPVHPLWRPHLTDTTARPRARNRGIGRGKPRKHAAGRAPASASARGLLWAFSKRARTESPRGMRSLPF
jgi:hypothetical protein